MHPESVHFAADTALGRDATVEPYVCFGPGVSVGDGATVRAFSHLEGVRIGAGATVGPFARLRPGSEIGEGARVGNFVEIKAAALGAGSKVNHLSYVGDARVGGGANVGAGVITCNYDGFAKHRTEIGEGAFIGRTRRWWRRSLSARARWSAPAARLPATWRRTRWRWRGRRSARWRAAAPGFAARAAGPRSGTEVMCGIIGVVGSRAAAPLLLDGLKRLEYRGYDSAGVATLVDGAIERRRADGKLDRLAALLAEKPLAGAVGIGHTRWATHGAATTDNAHPHADARVAVVHNGIVENFQELRDRLVASGRRFETPDRYRSGGASAERRARRGDGPGRRGGGDAGAVGRRVRAGDPVRRA